MTLDELAVATIAVPGLRTTAYLALRLCLGADFEYVLVPFDRILDAVAAGQYEGRRVDAGLIIHEGQLTYADQRLATDRRHGPVVARPDRPAFAAGGQRHPQGSRRRDDPRRHRLLRESIAVRPGPPRRGAGLRHELRPGAGSRKADQFVEHVRQRLDARFRPRGREAVARCWPKATRPA